MHSYLVWVLGVMVWVWTAMQIEGHGRNIFKMMWISCLFRFAGETWVLLTMFKYFKWEVIGKGAFGKQGEVEGEKESGVREIKKEKDVKEKKKV